MDITTKYRELFIRNGKHPSLYAGSRYNYYAHRLIIYAHRLIVAGMVCVLLTLLYSIFEIQSAFCNNFDLSPKGYGTRATGYALPTAM